MITCYVIVHHDTNSSSSVVASLEPLSEAPAGGFRTGTVAMFLPES